MHRHTGRHDAASNWRLQQQLAELQAVCQSMPAAEQRPVQAQLARAFTLLSTADSNKDKVCEQVAQHLTNVLQHSQQSCRQYTASLVHAHLFLSWRAVHQQLGADKPMTSGRQLAATPQTHLHQDPWGKCAGWQLSSQQYAYLVHTLRMEVLMLDMLAWLPAMHHELQAWPAQQLLLAEAVAAHPPLVSGMLTVLGPGPGSLPNGEAVTKAAASAAPPPPPPPAAAAAEQAPLAQAWHPGSFWALLLVSLQQHDSCIHATDARVHCLSQLTHAAGWAASGDAAASALWDVAVSRAALHSICGDARLPIMLEQPADTAAAQDAGEAGDGSGADDMSVLSHSCLVAIILQLLEHLLCEWGAPVAEACAGNCDFTQLVQSLQQLQALLQRASTLQGVVPQQLQVHLQTRLMLFLMMSPPGVSSTCSTTAAAAASAAEPEVGCTDRSSWHQLDMDPLQWQSSIGMDAPPLWMQRVMEQPAHDILLALVLPCHQTSSPGSTTGGYSTCLANVHVLAQHRTSVSHDAVAEHIAAMATAWLTPGVLSWWQLPRSPAIVQAAGPDCWGPLQLSAMLLDMLAFCIQQQEQQQQRQQAELVFLPGLRHLLLAMAIAAARRLPSKAQQSALLSVTTAPPPSLPAQLRALRAHLASDSALQASAARALVTVSNRLAARDEGGELVMLSAAQQALLVAEMGKDLVPFAALWPRLTLKRLLTDALHHRGQLDLVVSLLQALALAASQRPTAAAPTLLMRELRKLLLAPSSNNTALAGFTVAAAATGAAVSDTAAAQLAGGLVSARLVSASEALQQLVVTPLGQAWQGLQSQQVAQVRVLLAVAQKLLGLQHRAAGQGAATGADLASGSSGPWCPPLAASSEQGRAAAGDVLAAVDWLSLVSSLAVAACQLHQQAMEHGPLDYSCHAAAEGLLEAVAGLCVPLLVSAVTAAANPSPAAQQDIAEQATMPQAETTLEQDASSSASDDSAVARLLAAATVLPWAGRVKLLPLLSVLSRQAGTSSSMPHISRQAQHLLCPPAQAGAANTRQAEKGGCSQLSASVEAISNALCFAMGSEHNASLLARAFESSAHTGMAARGLAEQLTCSLAAAIVQLPADQLRQAALLALGRLLPFATEAQAGRVLLLVLPALAHAFMALVWQQCGCEVASAHDQQGAMYVGTDMSQAVQQGCHWVCCLQLACRATFVFVKHGRWCKAHGATAQQQAAEQCFRHINMLVLHMLAAASSSSSSNSAGDSSSDLIRYHMSQRCLLEVCSLTVALHGVCESTFLQALLLQLLSLLTKARAAAQPASADAAAAAMGQIEQKEALDKTAILCNITTVAGTPYVPAILWLGQQLQGLPQLMQEPLMGALVHYVGEHVGAVAPGAVDAELEHLEEQLWAMLPC